MARSRPHGRSKSDHRVCQAARYARAAEYRERITISAEQQEERIAALNAECSVEDAPRRRRRQKSRESKTQGGAARLSARGSSCKASRSGKKKATKRFEHALGKAAKRDPHSLLCHTCCATAEFGLRGGKEGGCVRYFCKPHAMPSGCFRIDKDRAAWLEERELHHHLKAEVDRLEGELQQLGGASSTARPTSAWSDFPCAGDWVSKPMSFLLIATLLTIGGVESNPGPSIEEVSLDKGILQFRAGPALVEQSVGGQLVSFLSVHKSGLYIVVLISNVSLPQIAGIRESWLRANPKMDDTLVAYLVEQELDFASWMNQSDRDQDQSLSDLEAAYTKSRGNWKISWSVAIRAAVSSISLPQNAEIEESWPEANPRMEPALVAYLAEQELDLASWIKQSDRARVQSLAELTAAFTKSKGAWKMSWTVAIRSAAAEAVRRRHKAGAGQSTDVEMRDADQGDQNLAGPSGSEEPSGAGGLRGNQLRASGEGTWSDDFDQAISQIMSDAFAALDEHGVLQLEIWEGPRGRRKGLKIPKYKNGPSLLLHELPDPGQPGVSNADLLVAQCDKLHSGEQTESGHAILVLGPSGAGKTRTIYELLCKRFGFYHSFSTGAEPGTVVLETALRRFSAKHNPAYNKALANPNPEVLTAFREECSTDVLKFVVRILLAHALGLLLFLKQFETAATPKMFLLFQLRGAAGQKPTDWVLRIWEGLLSLSYDELASKLRDTTKKLQQRTGQAFFPVAVDEAQAGVNTPDWFPGSKRGTGRPLLSAWIRQLGLPVFEGYLFSFTGTGFAMTATSVLETGLAKQGSHLIFHEFGTFTGDAAQAFAEQYLGRSPSGVKALWELVAGRYRFTVQLVNFKLEDPSLPWGDAFMKLQTLHTELSDLPDNQTPDNKTLIGKLQSLKKEMLVDRTKQYNEFLMQLAYLAAERYVLGSGMVLASQHVDLIELGFCFLEILGPGRTADNMWAVFKEPLPAMAAKAFLGNEGLWDREEGLRRLFLNLPSESSTLGFAWERHFPQAQQAFLKQLRLASHPLLADLPGLPSCFERESSVVCLPDKGTSGSQAGDEHLVRHADDQYGLIDFVRDPRGRTFLIPEIWAGPDLAHFARLGKDLWFVILQSRLRNQLRDKVHAVNTVTLEMMFGGCGDKEQKREELVKELRKRNVKGILRMIVLYPGESHLSSFTEGMLRRSGRSERSHGFEVVQVAIDATNAHRYFPKKHLDLLDCLKNRPAFGTSAQVERDDMES